ncbi:MAG: trigger factor [Anaerovoracaceae bacterium]
MKKRIIALTLMVCMIGVLGLTGCGGVTTTYDKLNLDDYVKVGNYKGLEVEKYTISVSDKEVQTEIEKRLEDTSTTRDKKTGIVKNKDTLNIDYSGKINGKTFDGGSAKAQELTIGADSFIDGFSSGLVGKKIGSTVKLNLKFPKNYSEEKLQGKDVIFTVKINSVKETVESKYDVAWIKKNSKANDKSSYEKTVKEALTKQKKQTKLNEIKQGLWQEIQTNSEVLKYPDAEVQKYVDLMKAQYSKMAKSYKMEESQLWQQMGVSSEEEYTATLEQQAQQIVKQQLVMTYIAQKEDLSYSKKEAEEVAKNLETQGYTKDNIEESMGQTIEEYTHEVLTLSKVLDFMYDSGKQVDKKTETKKEATKETKKLK